MWGQGFGPAAELPLGAELYVSAGSTGDLVAGLHMNRVFNGGKTLLASPAPMFMKTNCNRSQLEGY